MIALREWSSKWDEPIKRVDLSRLMFPTDGLTFKKIREVNCELFDKGGLYGKYSEYSNFCEDELFGLLAAERLLALFAFAQAKGIEPPFMEYDAIHEEATELYVRYGLARGTHEASELIRDVERQARELANERQK